MSGKEIYEEVKHEENSEETLEQLLERINSEVQEDENFQPFTITSDIGRDDYRAFFYYSVLGKTPVIAALLAAAPLIASFIISYSNNQLNATKFAIMAVLFYILVAGLVVLRAELAMNKIRKNSPETLMLTKTIYSFKSNDIFYTKNNVTIKVPYQNLLRVGKALKRYYLYFAGQKAMVIRSEDVKEVMSVADFEKFINTKVKE